MKKAVGLLAVLFVLLSLTALSENGFAAIAPCLVITNASFVGIGDEIAAVTDAKDTLTVSGNTAGVIAGFYCDGTGVVQNMNFAVNISEALSLYEIVKEDEVAPLSGWQITDVGIKSFSNSERPMEFCMRDLPVRTLTIDMDEGYSIRMEAE